MLQGPALCARLFERLRPDLPAEIGGDTASPATFSCTNTSSEAPSLRLDAGAYPVLHPSLLTLHLEIAP